MEVLVEQIDHIKIVKISGDLNANTSPDAETKIMQLIMGGNRKLIIDLTGLNYISSAGLRIFLTSNKLIRKSEGEIRFCSLNHTVKEVFEISGFQMIFKIFNDLGEALKGF